MDAEPKKQEQLSAANFLTSQSWAIAAELGLAVLIGAVLQGVGVGGGSWILAGIGAGALIFWLYHRHYPATQPNRTARKIGQLLVGLTVGFSIQHSNGLAISAQMPVFLGLTVFLLLSGVAIGYVYSQLDKIDLLTALLATTPGNLGVMGSIAADYGRNASLVSLVQLMRFTIVTLVIPLITDTSQPGSPLTTLQGLIPTRSMLEGDYLLTLGAVVAIAAIAVHFGTRYKIPVAALLCSIGVGALFTPTLQAVSLLPSGEFSLPPLLSFLGQILLGITIGEYWAVNPRLSRGAVVRAILPVLLTLLAGLAAAAIAKFLTPWDWLTCLLVTAPGGSPEMIWIALTLNQNVEVVTAGHLIRLVAINLALPSFVALASHFDRQSSKLALDTDLPDEGETG